MFFDTHVNVVSLLKRVGVLTGTAVPNDAWNKLANVLVSAKVFYAASKKKQKNLNKNTCWLPLDTSIDDLVGCISVSCEPDTIQTQCALLDHAVTNNLPLWGGFGIHPCHAASYSSKIEAELRQAWMHERNVCYGEMGLDYHYAHMCDIETQKQTFIKQLECIFDKEKGEKMDASLFPLVLHTRDSDEDFLDILRNFVPRDYPIHVHCFTSSPNLAATLVKEWSKCYIGFTGAITYKNAAGDGIRQAARLVPMDRLVVESDGPFLPSEPFRGGISHPWLLPLVIESLYECTKDLHHLEKKEFQQKLIENARTLYLQDTTT